MTDHKSRHTGVEERGQWTEENALWYIRNYGEHPINGITAQRAQLKPVDTVLDIGCGSGSALRAALADVTVGELIGVDPSATMIAAAIEQTDGLTGAERTRFVEATAENLPLDRETVSVAWAVNSLHHWSDIPAGLAEVTRVLKTGGRFLAVEEIFEEDGRGMTGGALAACLTRAGFGIRTAEILETPDSRMNLVEAIKIERI
ncbi:class I SAM-dependent methyltransferase [Aestuariispira insulae]|uniref:Methyltransferase family protein n=1 Tax=Aestuariispira insulae TaxID=1461337 RepID=A0A3D9HWY0_9PROT|nr:class I SAM-dependent methyltransferase [Aestuariispira insulae]RED53997.1 methyltransferase family protein [Aestuariispira insulae]